MKKIAITMGDAAGIGPEIIAKVFLKKDIYRYGDIFVIGDLIPMLSAQRKISKNLYIKLIDENLKIERKKYAINLFDMRILKYGDYVLGENSKKAGFASFKYIEKAINFSKQKKISAIVTAPINKHSLHLAGLKYPGHTEILAKFFNVKKYAMMLASDKLKVVLVTIHESIKNVPYLLKKEKIFDIIKLTDDSLKNYFKIKKPKIAVLGLNPHASENGAFGNEEKNFIIPAILKATKIGIECEGPFPADTIFNKIVYDKKYDAAVCMYHDQGLIPLKLLSFDRGVNITLGLPVIRTSPDHGTAYDIAGLGIASEESLFNAIKFASQMTGNTKNS